VLEGLDEKKIGAIIVIIVALIAPAMILGSYVANALESPNFEPMMESIAILQNRQITENPTNINASIALLNCGGQPNSINAVKLGQIAQSGSPGVAVCVNGTYVNCAAVPLFVIQQGDTAIVNIVVPYTNYPYALSTLHNLKVVSITVFTDEAMYYVECNCTKVN
jgi:hypothetical protein